MTVIQATQEQLNAREDLVTMAQRLLQHRAALQFGHTAVFVIATAPRKSVVPTAVLDLHATAKDPVLAMAVAP